MTNNKDFDSSLIIIDKKCYKNIAIYNIGYITIKKIDAYGSINNVNPLCLLIGKGDGHIEENNGNKYLAFTSTNGNKKLLAKFTKLWDEIKHLVEAISKGEKGEYEKCFLKIQFNSDDNLLLQKMLKLHMLSVIARSDFKEGGKYYAQVFLDECLYEV